MVDVFSPGSQSQVPLRCLLRILQLVELTDLGMVSITSKAFNRLVRSYSKEDWKALQDGSNEIRDITVPLMRFRRSVNVDCAQLTDRGLSALRERLPANLAGITLRGLSPTVPIQAVSKFLAGLPAGVEVISIEGYSLIDQQSLGLLGQQIPPGSKRVYFRNCPAEGMLILQPGPGATDERVIALASGFEKPSRRKVETVNLQNCFRLTDACAGKLGKAVSQAKTIRLGGCTGFSESGMEAIFYDMSTGVETIDVKGCPGFTDSVASDVAMQGGQSLQRLDVRQCANLTQKGLAELFGALPMGCSEVAIGSNRANDQDMAGAIAHLKSSRVRQLTIVGHVGSQVAAALADLGFHMSHNTMGEATYSRANEVSNPRLREPSPPRSASNSPPKETVRIPFSITPTLVLVEDEGELTKLAETGDLKAHFALGKMYWDRSQNRQHADRQGMRKMAIKWLRPPARAGIHEAEFLLGCALERPKKGRTKEWIRLVKKAADGGLADAQVKVADAYRFGDDVPMSMSLRFKYLLMAAKQDHAEAQDDVSLCYSSGEGTEECRIEAFEWKLKAARNGHDGAQLGVGRTHFIGIYGYLDVYPQKGLDFIRESANQGNDSAKVLLGKHLRDGCGIPGRKKYLFEDRREAVKLFREVADRPCERSIFSSCSQDAAKIQLAICLAEGLGLDRDPTEALRIIEELYADKGLLKGDRAELAYYYATCFETGRLVPQDYKRAIELYTEAKQDPSCLGRAFARLGLCHLNGWGTPINQELAYKLFDRAYYESNIEAIYQSARCLENGWGVKKDKSDAKYRYKKVIEKGDRTGMYPRYTEAKEGFKRCNEICVVM